MSQAHTLIFAKAPVPGFAKTRLIPELGEDGAAALARRLLEHSVRQAMSAHIGPVELCVTPDPQQPIWSTQALPPALTLTDQGSGDLGERMARAVRRTLPASSPVSELPVLLTGTDCPALDSACLQVAARALTHHDCCLVPAHDGGYTLLGLRQYHPSLFADIPWSTADVAGITRTRIHALGWSLAELPPLHDIDEPADLIWLPDHWNIQ